MTLTQVAHL